MPEKLFRDPLYDYIAIDKDSWLLKLIACPEVQRLRYISQLGLSQFTYPGAIHSRFSHCLGALHLMKESIEYLQKDYANCFQTDQRDALLAATLLHDIGHGPFSHATESFFKDHERRGVSIIMDSDSSVHKELTKVDKELPAKVAALIAKKPPKGVGQPTLWQRALISSQLDADRLDFLRRDSLFSGAEYGNFDWYRIIHTMKLKEYPDDTQKTHMFWPDKSKYALEEYIFSRFYMYQSVYFHHTTRGFESLLRKLLEYAQSLANEKKSFAKTLLTPLRLLRGGKEAEDFTKFLALTDDVLLAQVRMWQDSKNKILADLAGRLLCRKGLAWHALPPDRAPMEMHKKINAIEEYLKKAGLRHNYYFFQDETKATPYKPYSAASSSEELSSVTSIMLFDQNWPGTGFYEITQVPGLKRLQAITGGQFSVVRYYFPKEHEKQIKKLLG
ncbi:MAG: HD domain-containing protein [Planctomycetota bacterium]|jgi:HD superfamily phosphohydrolase